MAVKILLIDDDPGIADAVALNLRPLNFELEHIVNGREGLNRALAGTFDLVVVDVMLPELNGFDICRELRRAKPALPILFLTACAEEIDVVVGLEHGADDYLSKPFRVRELVARIRSLLRRGEISASTPNDRKEVDERKVIKCDPLTVDVEARKAWIAGSELVLTTMEFDLLVYFASQPGKSIAREALVSDIWGYAAGEYDATVNSQVCKLRKKLSEHLPDHDFIATVRGFGYRFELPEPSR